MALHTTTLKLAPDNGNACGSCLQQELLKAEGIKAVDEGKGNLLVVTYEDLPDPAFDVERLIAQTQTSLEQRLRHETLILSGLDCADCAATLEKGLRRMQGLVHVSVNFATSKMAVGYEATGVSHARLVKRVRELGYSVVSPLQVSVLNKQVAEKQEAGASCGCGSCADEHADEYAHAEEVPAIRENAFQQYWQSARAWLPTLVAALLWSIAFLLSHIPGVGWLSTLFYALAICVGGYRVALSGFFALVRGRTLGINLLMTIAVVGAVALGQWSEGAAVVVLFALGEFLEGFTMERVRDSLRSLVDLSPKSARIKVEGEERQVLVDALRAGDVVLVRPGERIAADGKILSGATTVNQAPITGESIPVEKQVGDEVFAGTLNEHGFIEVQASKRVQDSMLAKIIALVQEAQGSRAPVQRFVDRFAQIYTPAIMVLALLVAIVPPLAFHGAWTTWIYKALVLLVIACPCALVISTPVSIVAAIGRASRSGVLIKGGAYLEALARVKVLAFDKTGTLTQGQPVVTDVLPLGTLTEDELLSLAVTVESRSEHPLARAILREGERRQLAWNEPESFLALPGRGAQATIGADIVLVGSTKLFPACDAHTRKSIETLQRAGKTILIVGRNEEPLGLIAVADQVRPEAAQAIAQLKQAGVEQIVMLTGDNEQTAKAVAQHTGVDQVYAGLLPDQKVSEVKKLLTAHTSVAMLGDGINDAPAIALSSVGIAMGAAGSDTAIETADVALMKDDLAQLPFVIRLSRAALRTIQTNIAFSLFIKALFLLLTLLGVTNLWLAIFADTGAALLVIAYSMRLLRFEKSK